MVSTLLATTLLAAPTEPALELPSGGFTGLVSTLIVLLLVATAVALVTRRLRIPYVVGLVLAGLAITKQALPESVGLNPDVILNLFLPILIFEAAINTDVSRLRSTIKPIALLAGPGVVLSAVITAVLLQTWLNLAWITAAAVGVILTITDTVSVIVAFRSVPVPARLTTIVEGESLFNDGIALVLLSLIATIHLEGSFSLGEGVQQVVIAFVGGGVLGWGLGYLCVGLFRQLDDALSIFERQIPHREEADDADYAAVGADVIVYGLGRYGGWLVNSLASKGLEVHGVDFDPENIRRWRRQGFSAHYGDAEDPEYPSHLALSTVRWVVSSIPGLEVNRTLQHALQHHGYRGKLAVTVHNDQEDAVFQTSEVDLILRPFVDAAEQAADELVRDLQT